MKKLLFAMGAMLVSLAIAEVPYQIGVAGYTLVYHSKGFYLAAHEPFTSTADAVAKGTDIISTRQIIERSDHRILVDETERGAEMRMQINDLRRLLTAYRRGYIKEH